MPETSGYVLGISSASPRRHGRIAAIPAQVWAVIALTALGGIVRFGTIASQSFWLDEARTAHELQLSFGSMLSTVVRHETNPPLYYVLGWVWTRLFGSGTAELRSLSVLAGTAVIPIAYLCARELVSPRAGLVAAALAAVNPFMVWYSQEARPYILLAVLTGASFYWFARCWSESSTANLSCWAAFSALALATHFFAGFLVATEAIGLLWRARSRAMLTAAGAVAAVQLAIIPLAVGDTSHGVGWIAAIPLSIRLKQVPTELGLSTLYRSPVVSHGLLGAALLLACVVGLLRFATRDAQRGAAIAGAAVAAVVVVPLVLSQLGQDYFLTRNLIAAWVPLAVLLGAACTVPRAWIAGAALAASLLIAFVVAGTRIASSSQYQRPDWRGVATALGAAGSERAIVAYPGAFAGEPLAFYLPGVPWTTASGVPVSVGEVDIVANTGAPVSSALPGGTRLIGVTQTPGYEVARFSLAAPWRLTPAQIGARAAQLVASAPPAPSVLVQAPGRA